MCKTACGGCAEQDPASLPACLGPGLHDFAHAYALILPLGLAGAVFKKGGHLQGMFIGPDETAIKCVATRFFA